MESVEDILRLKPTLVIGSVPYKQETVAKLLEHPLNFLAMNPRTLADVASDINLLGRIAGHVREANRLNRKMRDEFAAIARSRQKNAKPIRMYCEAWPNPRISSPPWVAELAEICGAEMVVPAGEKVSDAQVAETNPDVIVLAWAATGDNADATKAYEVQAWKEVPAIRNRRVYVVRDELLNSPGPPLLEGSRALHKIIASVTNERGRR
jgi:iron complex transport system substrate-binding protein